MSFFLNMLKEIKESDRQIVVALNGGEKLMIIVDINDDAVTLAGVESNERYDLHFTHVVIAGQSESP